MLPLLKSLLPLLIMELVKLKSQLDTLNNFINDELINKASKNTKEFIRSLSYLQISAKIVIEQRKKFLVTITMIQQTGAHLLQISYGFQKGDLTPYNLREQIKTLDVYEKKEIYGCKPIFTLVKQSLTQVSTLKSDC